METYSITFNHFSEILAGILFSISNTIYNYPSNHQVSNNTLELPFTNCLSHHKPVLNQIDIFCLKTTFLIGLSAVARSAELFVFPSLHV